uniref:DOMON domain-containing protein n=1 Tax=Ditylenchus dipsaci TaxID=166011 RepID=A0A915CUU8_9BILA
MLTLFWIFLTTFAIILVFDHPVYGLRRYEKPSSLSRSVVFVLRAEFQDVGDSLWTGVGFGDRNNDSIIDFIGVFVKDSGAQTGITDTHINSTTGQFTPDVNTNVQTISIAVSNAAGSTGTQVTAKFARAINSKDTQEDLDLDGCTIFNMPLQPMASVDHSEQQGNYLKSLKQLKVCDIQKHCTVDIRELKLKGETKVIKKLPEPISPPKPSTEDPRKSHESSAISKPHLQASPSVEVAHSVDISGKGDPCSFTAPTTASTGVTTR